MPNHLSYLPERSIAMLRRSAHLHAPSQSLCSSALCALASSAHLLSCLANNLCFKSHPLIFCVGVCMHVLLEVCPQHFGANTKNWRWLPGNVATPLKISIRTRTSRIMRFLRLNLLYHVPDSSWPLLFYQFSCNLALKNMSIQVDFKKLYP
jgi:hypothetical protein